MAQPLLHELHGLEATQVLHEPHATAGTTGWYVVYATKRGALAQPNAGRYVVAAKAGAAQVLQLAG